MMRKPILFLSILISTTLLFLNCSSNNESQVNLTSSQSNAVIQSIGDSLGLIVDGSLSQTAGLSAANFITVDVSNSDSCDGGGTNKATGTQAGVVDSTIDGATDVEVKFTDCKAQISSTRTITINGTLDSVGTIELSTSELGIDGSSSVSYTGSLELSGDDLEEAGNCDVDLVVTANAQGDSIEISSTGTLCGESVNYTYTVNL